MIQFDPKEFASYFAQYPDSVKTLIREILNFQLHLVLVGGGVRDFLLTHKLVKDLDFEIFPNKEMSTAEWEKERDKLNSFLAANYKVEKLNFGVTRIYLEDIEIELAPARVEIYSDDQNKEIGHSDFEIEYILKSDFSKSFCRRDFTVNAIGIQIDYLNNDFSFELNDPFHGIGDLNRRILKQNSVEFVKDPVRLLRAIRFSQKLNFSFHENLKKSFSYFNLSKLTKYYLDLESSKVNFNLFYRKLSEIVFANEIPTSPALRVVLAALPKFNESVNNLNELFWATLKTQAISNKEEQEIINFFALKKKSAKEIKLIQKLVKDFENNMLNTINFENEFVDLNDQELSFLSNLNSVVEIFHTSEPPVRRELLSIENLEIFTKLALDIEALRKNQKWVENRKKIDDNLRSVYFLWHVLSAQKNT